MAATNHNHIKTGWIIHNITSEIGVKKRHSKAFKTGVEYNASPNELQSACANFNQIRLCNLALAPRHRQAGAQIESGNTEIRRFSAACAKVLRKDFNKVIHIFKTERKPRKTP
jgi:hypothetical protein